MTDDAQHIAGRWAITGTIGQGGMGDVYRGRDLETGEPVAIKLLKPDIIDTAPNLIERFAREGELLRQLDHPNIVQMLDMVEEDELHYLVMEYVPGGSLQERIRDAAPLPVEQVLEIALDLADALTRAHRLSVIHRDLKPANVLLAEDGTPRLTDFGVALVGDATSLTGAGSLVGTIHYLSPEACNGEPLDARTDIWAFGVMLFEMLTGQRPFTGPQAGAVVTAILQQPVPDLEQLAPDAPVGLVDLIYRMMEKERDARIPSVRLVGAELEALMQGGHLGRWSRTLAGTPANAVLERTNPSGLSVFQTPVPMRDRPRHNLQTQLTPFVGREAELDELHRIFQDDAVRLVTVAAPGGMGKTRLALEYAARHANEYEGGVHFAPLVGVSRLEALITVIAEALYFSFTPADDRQEQLFTFLRSPKQRPTLLILDNFEHLLEAAPLVSEMLRAAPTLRVLVTSRERLNLNSEVVYDLEAMHVPERWIPELAQNYDVVRLFLQGAERAQPGFRLRDEDLPAVFAICRRVHGVPLGVVLAASWVEMLSLEEIAAELETGLDLLETDARDMPERQRSLRLVFDSTWARLSDDERAVFMKLSIFRGGVKRQIAQYVTRASLRTLASLVSKSLLRRDPETGRYEVHELLRQFGAEQLEATGQADTTRDIHSHYYMSFVSQREHELRGARQWDAMNEIDTDFENVRAAWQWGIRRGDGRLLHLALDALLIYALISRSFGEVEELLAAALARFTPRATPDAATVPDMLWARCVVRRELMRLPDSDRERIERALALAKARDDRPETALALWTLAYAVSVAGDYVTTLDLLAQSRALYRDLDDSFFTARVLSDIGLFHSLTGDYEQSRACLDRSLHMQRASGDAAGAAQSTLRQSFNASLFGDEA